LGAALAQAGIIADTMRLAYIVHYAELEALLCSGPRRGKQFTYALLDERAPQAQRLPRDEALAQLTLRYFSSHGPATVADFAWWSGLTRADVKAGLGIVGAQLAQAEIEGQLYYFSPESPPAPSPGLSATLLPTYDEYVIGYTDRSALFDPPQTGKFSPWGQTAFDSMVLINGYIVGSWRRSIRRGIIFIELETFQPLDPAQQQALENAAQCYGKFMALPVQFA
jgi:hypothetical protein